MYILPLMAICGGLWGHCGLNKTSEVKADLKIELSDLNYLCSHASLACKGFPEMIDNNKRGQLWSIDLRCFAAGKNQTKSPVSYSRFLVWFLSPVSQSLELTLRNQTKKPVKWPLRLKLIWELKSATSNTLIFMCILPLTAILVASEAIVASKRPRRSRLA